MSFKRREDLSGVRCFFIVFQREANYDSDRFPLNIPLLPFFFFPRNNFTDMESSCPRFQSRLNIPDLPIGGFAVSPGSAAVGGAAAAAEEEEAAPAAQEKTLFTLKLESFDAAAKPKVIKEIKSMLGLSLVDSKKFVETAPKVMKENVPKEEAEKILETLKGLGAKVVME